MHLTNREIQLIAKWWNQGWREDAIREFLVRDRDDRRLDLIGKEKRR